MQLYAGHLSFTERRKKKSQRCRLSNIGFTPQFYLKNHEIYSDLV